KAVGLDLEHEAAGTLAPSRARDGASMRVALRCGAFDRERAKAVIAAERRRAHRQNAHIERAVERPLDASTERRMRGIVGADVIAVPSRYGIEACVKGRRHLVRRG